jgi:Ca2+-binding RTX toxin-like protein
LGPGNVDVVRFMPGEDVIALDARIFAGALDSPDRLIFDVPTGALLYDADGTGPAAAVQFATLTGVVAPLSAADFVLV